MKKKRTILYGACSVAFAVMLILSGCSFAPKAEDVSPETLGNYTGTVPSSETEAEQAFASGMGEFSEGFNEIDTETETPRAILEGFIRGLGSQAQPKKVTIDSDYNPDGTEGTVTIDITDETVNGSDIAAGGSGTMTVENLELKTTTESDFNQVTGTGSINAELRAEGTVLFSQFDTGKGYEITDGKINIGALVDGKLTLAETSMTLDYKADFKMKIGLSISGDNGVGGKYILNFEYSEKTPEPIVLDWSKSYTEQALGSSEVTFNATLEVYNNENELVRSITYTKDEILSIVPYEDIFL